MKCGAWLGLALCAVAAMPAVPGMAQDISSVRLRAFGQVGLGLLVSGEDADVTDLATDPATGAPVTTTATVPTKSYGGYDKDSSWERDTRFGINLSGDINKNLAFSLGLLVERYSLESAMDRGPSWPVRTTLAALRIEPGYNTSLSAGRLSAPFWLISDEKYVGITYPWITPPLEVYNLVSGTDNLNGARLSHTINAGDLMVKPSVFAGTFPGYDAMSAGDFRGGGGTIDADYDWLTFRLMYCKVRGTVLVDLSSQQAIQTAANQTVTVMTPLSFDINLQSTFQNIGLRATPGRLLVMAEYATTAVREITATGPAAGFTGSDVDRVAYYATAGYWLGAVMPRLTYSEVRGDNANLDKAPLGRSLAGAPASVRQGVEATAKRGLNLVNHSRTWNLGVNVQLDPGAVLKLEYQQTQATSDTYYGLFRLAPKASARLAQAALTFVL